MDADKSQNALISADRWRVGKVNTAARAPWCEFYWIAVALVAPRALRAAVWSIYFITMREAEVAVSPTLFTSVLNNLLDTREILQLCPRAGLNAH
jgi:hypothetical protein